MFNAILPDPVATSNKPPPHPPRGLHKGYVVYVCFNYILLIVSEQTNGTVIETVRGFYSFLVFRIARRRKISARIFFYRFL
jgi:hypothetical protein